MKLCNECARGRAVVRRLDDYHARMDCGHWDGNAYVVADDNTDGGAKR